MTVSFDKLELNSNLIEGLLKNNIKEPTDIQIKSIPLILQNKNVIAQSQTGTGKTLAYLLPLFEKIDATKREMQVIVLAPTHELVMQIHNEITTLSNNSNSNVTSCAIIGEVNIKRQIEKLREKPHIIVGSAGRVFELIKKRKISAHTIKTIVLDEGDRLLDKNNLPKVKDVIKTTMRDTQLILVSATISQRTFDVAQVIIKDPEFVKVKASDLINPNISHMYFQCEARDKIEILRKLIASTKPNRAIVFINKPTEIDVTTSKLQYHKINAYSISGKTSKEDRKKAIDGFKRGKYQILIASDVAARGLDVTNITHIFNLDLPSDSMDYLHRVGRCGRADKLGTAMSIVTESDLPLIKKYENKFNIHIDKKKIFQGKIS
ncbi:ATP-dependent helicase [Clostridium novyi]|uniref:DEAD/DEAH box helicase n=1 Tax=Clostridium novyi TaxID=1542 RepID=UPI000EA04D7F|nr:DEAD/DEAH box helicase [Clostridium novyi]AYF53468.1 ATP-dependent helicase [Clostridium novyi]